MKRLTAFVLTLAFAFSAYGQNTGRELDQSGNQLQSNFNLEIIKGDVQKHSHVDKFGAINNVGTTWTIISSSNTYQTPTAAAALEVVSSSANDAAAGSGIQEICIQGLGSGWQDLTECKEMNGHTAVDFDSSFVRVFRMYGNRTGSYATAAGPSHNSTITLQGDAGGAIWATLESESSFGFGQSLIGAYTVPRGYTGYVLSYHIDIEGTKAPTVAFFKRCNADDVTGTFDGVMRLQALHRGIDQNVVLEHQVPLGPFPGPCDVGFFGKVPSGTSDISVQFEILLVKD